MAQNRNRICRAIIFCNSICIDRKVSIAFLIYHYIPHAGMNIRIPGIENLAGIQIINNKGVCAAIRKVLGFSIQDVSLSP